MLKDMFEKIAESKGTTISMINYIDREFNPVEPEEATTVKVVYGNGDVAFYTNLNIFGGVEVSNEKA